MAEENYGSGPSRAIEMETSKGYVFIMLTDGRVFELPPRGREWTELPRGPWYQPNPADIQSKLDHIFGAPATEFAPTGPQAHGITPVSPDELLAPRTLTKCSKCGRTSPVPWTPRVCGWPAEGTLEKCDGMMQPC